MSQAGNAWKDCYKKRLITWCDPENLTYSQLERFSQSEWVESLVRALPKDRDSVKILEAGCGLGLYSLAMAIRGFQEIDAFDYSEEAVQIAKGFLGKFRNKNPKLRVGFYKDDLLNLKKLSGDYDFVFNQAVLDYFCDEKERMKALSEMVRVTKSGGKVALIVQHTKHPFYAYWKKIGWPGYVDQPPITSWSPEILRESLLAAGLSNIQISGLQPWKSLFFWPLWHKKFWITEQMVYLIGRVLEKLPCPNQVRAYFGIQLIGIGTKP